MVDRDGSSFKKVPRQSEPTPEARAYNEGFHEGRVMGVKEGRTSERALLLGLLEKAYMDPEIQRGSVQAQVILDISRDIGRFYRANPIGDGE